MHKTVRLRCEPLERRDTPATLVVRSLNDSGPGTLREAVGLANATAEADTVVFAPDLAGGEVGLTTAGGPLSALVVTAPLAIAGTGQTVRRRSGNMRLFLSADAPLALDGLTLAD